MKFLTLAVTLPLIFLAASCSTTVPESVDGVPLTDAEKRAVGHHSPELAAQLVRKVREANALSGQVGQLRSNLEEAHAVIREKNQTIARNFVHEASTSLILMVQDWRTLQGLKKISEMTAISGQNRGREHITDASQALNRHWRDYWRHIEQLSSVKDMDVSEAMSSHLTFLSKEGFQVQRRLTEHIAIDRRYFLHARGTPSGIDAFMAELEKFGA